MSQTSVSTEIAKGFAGMLADSGESDIVSGVSTEATDEIPFGVAVTVNAASNDDGVELPDASGDKIRGIVVHSHAYAKGGLDPQLGDTGIKPKQPVNVLRKGRIWVTVENGCTPLTRGYVRYAAGAGGTQLGAIRSASVSSETIDATAQIVFMTTAAAGELAIAEVDFTNKP